MPRFVPQVRVVRFPQSSFIADSVTAHLRSISIAENLTTIMKRSMSSVSLQRCRHTCARPKNGDNSIHIYPYSPVMLQSQGWSGNQHTNQTPSRVSRGSHAPQFAPQVPNAARAPLNSPSITIILTTAPRGLGMRFIHWSLL